MPSAHVAAKHELLVRLLDAWTPAALHGHKRVTYVEDPSGDSAVAAARVFGEFADKLRGRALTMVLSPADEDAVTAVFAEYGDPPGLSVHPFAGDVETALREAHAVGAPIFGWFDEGLTPDALSIVASSKGSEVLLGGAEADTAGRLRAAGLPRTARVDLVDQSGRAESLVFATGSEKALEKFKDELWALDEYAGVRLRDPGDAEGTLLDIRVEPNLAPLRRALTSRLATGGPATLADLRMWTVRETIFRTGDATKAVQALVAAGGVARTPPGGRLSVDTLLALSDA